MKKTVEDLIDAILYQSSEEVTVHVGSATLRGLVMDVDYYDDTQELMIRLDRYDDQYLDFSDVTDIVYHEGSDPEETVGFYVVHRANGDDYSFEIVLTD